jgi:hypothetical protein
MPPKISFDKIKEAFEKWGCELLISEDEYKGIKQQIEWRCKCGRLQKSTIGSKTKAIHDPSYVIQCRSCGIRKSKGAPSYKDFCSMLEKEGWEMLDGPEKFLNTKAKMKVKTKSGHEMFTTYNRFHQGHRSKIDKDTSERHSQEKVEEDFKKKGFELLDIYLNKTVSVKYKYKYKCGKISTMRYENLKKNKVGCSECVREYRSEISGEVRKKQQKSGYSYKTYVFPSGRKEQFQGYEGRCIDDLLSWGISEEDIVVADKHIPNFYYIYEGIKRRYFPDIYLKSTKTVIEVKSIWTYATQKDKNIAKFRAVAKMGYPMDVYIYSAKELVEHHHYIEDPANGDISDIYPPNFNFRRDWDRLCAPHLKKKKIKLAMKRGILKTRHCKLHGYDPMKPPGHYSAHDCFFQYTMELEEKIMERDMIHVIGEEDDWYEENEPETYNKWTKGRTKITQEKFWEKLYENGGELTFSKRWKDIHYYIPRAECHVWNPTFSLALAQCVYPDKEWEVVKGYYHTTVVDKKRTMCFDLVYANLSEKDEFPNPLKEALRKEYN